MMGQKENCHAEHHQEEICEKQLVDLYWLAAMLIRQIIAMGKQALFPSWALE